MQRREGLATIGRQAAEEMPTHIAKRPNPGRTTARASVEGRHLLNGFIRLVRRRSTHNPRRTIRRTKGGPSFVSCALRVRCIMPSMHAFGYWTARICTRISLRSLSLCTPSMHMRNMRAGGSGRKVRLSRRRTRARLPAPTSGSFASRFASLFEFPARRKMHAKHCRRQPDRPRYHAIPAPCARPTSGCGSSPLGIAAAGDDALLLSPAPPEQQDGAA
jgi:hypothetical protein